MTEERADNIIIAAERYDKAGTQLDGLINTDGGVRADPKQKIAVVSEFVDAKRQWDNALTTGGMM